MAPTKDKLFLKNPKIHKFEFNDQVASVFDDMVSRSVPFYNEIHRIILDLSGRILQKNDLVHDLGCSTGTTIALMDKHMKAQKKPVRFVGVDSSESMLKKCRTKLKRKNVTDVELFHQDICELDMEKSGMVIMNYTLQFIPTHKREKLLKNIHKSLRKNGILIMSEKITSTNRTVNNLLINLYHDFKKRNGYSELEIARKRNALENVLIPIPSSKQLTLLRKAGFKKVEEIFRWYNFACFIGIK
ncbi:MAG: carboxy-S-adenosyl-L-methionine synthase CmoA [Bacteriovoracaceae bacterium]|nr:carboxy-S-adenosyl-L-methionine synthase CmoA [Bacteriovoracaceae bacterium]